MELSCDLNRLVNFFLEEFPKEFKKNLNECAYGHYYVHTLSGRLPRRRRILNFTSPFLQEKSMMDVDNPEEQNIKCQ